MPSDPVSVLRLRGPQSAGDLTRLLGVSRPTLMRAVRAAGDAVVTRGRARRTAYAARRGLRGSMAPLPLYRVGLGGEVQAFGQLHLTVPDGSAVDGVQAWPWPLEGAMLDGWFDGLPYPLQDLRPQGFLGRHFARHHAALLQVAEDPTRWSDDDALHALALLGADTPGDLVVGEVACALWLERLRQVRAGEAPPPLPDSRLEADYPRLAAEAMAAGLPASSAGGEFPKFTALRTSASGAGDVPAADEAAEVRHVIVKFSGSDESPGTQRWADLLVCEQLAGEVLRQHLDVPAARSRIHRLGGRTFLEVERFDRHGRCGRSALVSWAAVDGAFFGRAGRPWTEAARQLSSRGWLGAADAQRLARLWHFGRLIGNSDMHDGNLSFQSAADGGPRSLRLAPAYDMLPMRWAPLRGGELPPARLDPSLPLPAEQPEWMAAAKAAGCFWDAAAADARISAGFRAVCAENALALRRLSVA